MKEEELISYRTSAAEKMESPIPVSHCSTDSSISEINNSVNALSKDVWDPGSEQPTNINHHQLTSDLQDENLVSLY